jgi:hypothetical protein
MKREMSELHHPNENETKAAAMKKTKLENDTLPFTMGYLVFLRRPFCLRGLSTLNCMSLIGC